tara:strand:+ start:1970 stop:2998 length:1029 start_codon:yes stop_codon:yes gene_type:complete
MTVINFNDRAVISADKARKQELNSLEIRHTSTSMGSAEVEHDVTLNNRYTQNLGVLESPDFFEPIEAPLIAEYEGNLIDVPNRKAIIRSDTGKVISTVGQNYKVINNATVFSQFDEALAESQIDLTGAYKRVSVCRGGAQTILAYAFPAYETTVTDREVGDVVRLTTLARNSYDGSSMFMARFSQDRLVCKNSMVGMTDISYFAGKHTQNLQIEHAVEKIKQSIDVYCQNVDLYKRWAKESVSIATAKRCFEKLCVMAGYNTSFNEKRVNEYMDQFAVESSKLGLTKWALYNTLTHISTHQKVQAKSKESGNSPIRQVKREEKLVKFLAGKGREFLNFSAAA